MSNIIPPMLIELQLETAKIQAQMGQLNGKFEDFGKTVTKQGSFLEKFKAAASGVFAGNLMVTGLNAVQGAMRAAIQDAQEYEVLLNKTAAVIQSTGNVAGISVQGLQAQANALEGLSAIDENIILNGENVIATFTNIRNVAGQGNDIFNQTTKAALDLSAALGQDMQSSSIQLGKALNDPIKGVTALQRVGVTFDAQQKEMIKTLMNSGDVLGAQKIILAEVNREFGGAAKAAGDTFAGAVFRAKDKVADFARDLITNLQPILLNIGKTIGDLYNKFLAPLFGWINKNKEAVALFVGIIGTAVVAFKVYQGVMAMVTAAQELYIVATALMRGAKLADIAATEGQTGAMVALNAVMNANPIALVVVAVAALAAGFVVAWNHSETFRKVVVNAFQAVLSAVSWALRALGEFVDFANTYLILPFKTLLQALSHLPGVGKYAKEALKFMDNIPDTLNKAADKVDQFSKSLDKLQNKKISIPGFGGSKETAAAATKTATSPTAVTAENIKAAAAAAKAAEKANESYQKTAAALQDKIASATKKFNDKMLKITDTYNAKVSELNQKAHDKITDLEDKYREDRQKITEEFNVTMGKLNQKRFEDEAKLTLDNQKRNADIIKSGAEKLASIVQSSIDRLRGAFAQGTAFNVGDIFKGLTEAGTASADELLKSMQTKLAGAKQLMANAAALQAQGFSQTFIEQVVSQGPEVGNKLAESLKNATPETIKSLQDTYSQMEATTNHGLDALGSAMNTGGKLATDELTKAYAQAQKDTADALIEQAKIFSDAQKEIAKNFDEAMKEAEKTRDTALAALAKDFSIAVAGVNKDLKDALKEAYDEMVTAQDEAKTALSDALDTIQKDFDTKLGKIKTATNATTSAIQAMVTALNAARALAALPMPTPGAGAATYVGGTRVDTTTLAGIQAASGISITQNISTPNANPAPIIAATVSAIKYGTSTGLSYNPNLAVL